MSLTSLFLIFFCALSVFAANEDVVNSRNVLLEKRKVLLDLSASRNQTNAKLKDLYSEVQKNPSEENLRKLVAQLHVARVESWSEGRQLEWLRVYDFVVIPEFASYKTDFHSKRALLSQRASEDFNAETAAITQITSILNKNLQRQLVRDFARSDQQIKRKLFCEDLPGNISVVTGKAKLNALDAVEKRNLWFAELARKKIEVSRAVLARAQQVCGDRFLSSAQVLTEAANTVDKTLKVFPKDKIEKEICSSLPQGTNCTKLFSNPYFVAYVSQVSKIGLRNLTLPMTAKGSKFSAFNISFMPISAYAKGDSGIDCIGGICAGPGEYTPGTGGSNGGDGDGSDTGAGGGGSGNSGSGGHGRGNGAGYGEGRGGKKESKEDRERRERAELVQRLGKELGDNYKDLGDQVNKDENIKGLGADIRDVADQSFNETTDNFNFVEDIKNNVAAQTGDVSGLASGFFPAEPTSYKSDKASEYRKIESKMDGAETPQAFDAREAIKELLKSADEAQAEGDKEKAEFNKDLANVAADIGLSLTPGVSVGKDVYEALTGDSLITGEPLDGFSRGMAVVGVATVGASDYVQIAGKYGIRAGEKIIKLLDDENRVVRGIRRLKKLGDLEKAVVKEATKLLEKYGIKARAIYPGKSGKYVAIGRDMDRVREAKTAIGKEAEVLIFDGKYKNVDVISKDAEEQWAKERLKYAGKDGKGRIPPGEVRKTLMYKENKAWLEKAIEEGHTIIDLGNPANTMSEFYEMEIELLRELLKVSL